MQGRTFTVFSAKCMCFSQNIALEEQLNTDLIFIKLSQLSTLQCSYENLPGMSAFFGVHIFISIYLLLCCKSNNVQDLPGCLELLLYSSG